MDHLVFSLQIEDDWPPVAAECLPCSPDGAGFRVETAPLFVKELSAGDVVQVIREEGGQVHEWMHLFKSARSTVWLMPFGGLSLEQTLFKLRGKGCNTTSFSGGGLVAIDVPPSVTASELDALFVSYSDEQLAVAYPSWRHD